ncbi:MAG: hypothetical protein AB1571_01825 [Nanoarchaeota archaeon]
MKRGYLRTLEAVIAIILIFIFMYTITPKSEGKELKVPEGIKATQNAIFSGIQQSDELREDIYNADNDAGAFGRFDGFIEGNIPAGYSYTFMLCNKGGSCWCKDTGSSCTTPPSLPEKTVYAKSMLITVPGYKILRLYIWQ